MEFLISGTHFGSFCANVFCKRLLRLGHRESVTPKVIVNVSDPLRVATPAKADAITALAVRELSRNSRHIGRELGVSQARKLVLN
jgi:hypothetical protein